MSVDRLELGWRWGLSERDGRDERQGDRDDRTGEACIEFLPASRARRGVEPLGRHGRGSRLRPSIVQTGVAPIRAPPSDDADGPSISELWRSSV
jgi:hypothetical protein